MNTSNQFHESLASKSITVVLVPAARLLRGSDERDPESRKKGGS